MFFFVSGINLEMMNTVFLPDAFQKLVKKMSFDVVVFDNFTFFYNVIRIHSIHFVILYHGGF